MKHTKISVFFLVIALTVFSSMLISNDTYAAKINKKKATINVGDTLKLKVSGTNKKIKWSSSKKKVAKVSKSGVVTPKKEGKATITAKVGSKKLKCKIKVRPVYTISKSSGLIDVGSNKYSSYSSAYVNSYTKDWYRFRCRLEKLQNIGGGTIIVKKGTYNITNTLCIPSNVNIIFKKGVVINKTDNTHTGTFSAGATLFEFVPASKYDTKNWCSKYNGVHDSKLIGKGNVKINLNYYLYGVAITMCHNKNVTISGINFSNVNESHFIELDASKNVKIINCNFTKAKGKNYNREAINLDIPDSATDGFGKTWAKNDKTPNQKITIENCSFSDLYVGIGSHVYSQTSGGKNIYQKEISIKKCTIKNIKKYGISSINWAAPSFTNNKFSKCKDTGLYCAGVTNPTISNNSFSSCDTGIKLTHTTRKGYSITYTDITKKLLETAYTKNTFKDYSEKIYLDYELRDKFDVKKGEEPTFAEPKAENESEVQNTDSLE